MSYGESPRLEPLGDRLMAFWNESGALSTVNRLRVKEMKGANSWQPLTGVRDHLNFDSEAESMPVISTAILQNHLYVSWAEVDGIGRGHIRVLKY